MGRSEADILEELGNPRLIARTIIDTQGDAKQQYRDSVYYKEDIKEEFENRKPHFGVLDLTTWYGRAAAWIIGIFSLILLIWLISGILSIAIQIAIPVLAILAVYSLVKNFMRR